MYFVLLTPKPAEVGDERPELEGVDVLDSSMRVTTLGQLQIQIAIRRVRSWLRLVYLACTRKADTEHALHEIDDCGARTVKISQGDTTTQLCCRAGGAQGLVNK